MAPNNASEEPFPWQLGVFDAHCHPTDSMDFINEIPKMRARVLTVMATRSQDQELVAGLSRHMGITNTHLTFEGDVDSHCEILPAFGWHPWFSHQLFDDRDSSADDHPSKSDHYRATLKPSPDDQAFIDSLPDPKPLSEYLQKTKNYLEEFPHAMVGEIGIDRSFRVPEPDAAPHEDTEPNLTPGSREGRQLSPYRVDLTHQQKILESQLNLAGQMQRAVSVHGVAAHGMLFNTLQSNWKGHEKQVMSKRQRKRRESANGAHDHEDDEQQTDQKRPEPQPKPYPPRICLHSYSGAPETLKQYFHPSVPADIYLSFSQVINFSTPASSKAIAVIKAVPDHRVLVESDLHCAGETMDNLLQAMVKGICEVKEWPLDEGTKRLRSNWLAFAFG